MNEKAFYTTRLYFTAAITIAMWSLLIWDHFHEGVVSHHLLHRQNLPAFSNWWGGLLIPLLTWFLLDRVQKRTAKQSTVFKVSANVLYAFGGALSFGILLSLFFTMGNTEVSFYMMVLLLCIALIFPIYRAEYFLGFVMGMIFTFGGVLPIIIISIVSLLAAVLYLVVRPAISFVILRITYVLSLKKKQKNNA